MQLFLELLRESVIMRGILAIIVVVVVSYMVLMSQPVPEWFVALAGSVIGYFFGSRPASAVTRAREFDGLKSELRTLKGG